jgi:hypothetical protein
VPREFILFGVQFPTLLPLFFVGIAVLMTFNALFGRQGFYRQVWHPALVRLCVFVVIFGGSITWLYN